MKMMMVRNILFMFVLGLSMLTATARDYNVVEYGAKSDTTVLSTKALQQAIDDEKEKAYPEATMWGNLPAKGFYLRHTRNVHFDNVTVLTDAPDARPDFVRDDAE